MAPHLQKQILIGLLAGLLVVALTYILLGGSRSELAALKATNASLVEEVNKGYGLKANAEKLKAEVDQQQKLIEELIKIMMPENEVGELQYRVKKMADNAGIDQVGFTALGATPKEYRTEHTIQFTFRAGYHTFGEFASQISGFEKIISLSDIELKREGWKQFYPVTATCKIKAYVYTPPPAPKPAADAPKPAAAKPASAKEE